MKLKRVNEMSENIEIKNDMFKTEDFINYLPVKKMVKVGKLF